jgi:hypothetical protein
MSIYFPKSTLALELEVITLETIRNIHACIVLDDVRQLEYEAASTLVTKVGYV